MTPTGAGVGLRGLYAVTPDRSDTAQLVELVQAALEGGTIFIQYRNKSASGALKLEQARALKRACETHHAKLIVNDDIEVAIASGADGVHLGREDGDSARARDALGAGKLIGVSCYDDLDRALVVQRQGADYVAFGSMFPSLVKPGAVRAPLELLTVAKRELEIPIVAIGGITAENARQVIDAGANAIAVISALFDAVDVAGAATRLNALFDRHEAQR